MQQTKKENIIQRILDNVRSLDIAGYLVQEVEGFLKYIHYYKLKNIVENMEAFQDYLLFLDHQSTMQIKGLEYPLSFTSKLSYDRPYHVHYYVSKRGMEIIGEEHIMKKILEQDYNLMTVMQGIKGFLLLTVDEFCNASPTRMFINRVMWQKQCEVAEKLPKLDKTG